MSRLDMPGQREISARSEPPSSAVDAGSSKSPSIGDTAKTIAWSFFGIRRRVDHDQETPRINPIHIVVAGFIGVFLLVVGLIVLVNLVVAA